MTRNPVTRNPITHPITNQEFLKSPLYAPLQPYLWVQDKDKPTDYARAGAYRLANPSWLVQDPVRLSKILGIPCKSITVSAPNGLPELSRTHAHVTNAHVTNAHVTNAHGVRNIRGRRAYTQLISLCFIRIDLLIYLRAIALGVIPHGVNRNDIPQGTLSKLYLEGQGVYANQRGDTDYDYFGLPTKSPNSSLVYDDTLSTVLQTGDLSILTNRIKSLTDPNGPYYLATERAKPHMLWFFYNSSKAGVPIAKDALSILDAHAGLLEQQNREIYSSLGQLSQLGQPGLSKILEAQRAQGKTGQGLPNLCHFIPHSLIRFLVEDVLAKKDIHNRLGMGLQSNPAAVVLRNCVSLLQKISNQGPQFAKRLMQQNLFVESLGSSLAPLYTVPARSLPGKTPTNLTELSEELTKAFGAALDRGINERYPTMASLGMQSLSRYNSCFWIPRNIAADMIADEIECSIRSL